MTHFTTFLRPIHTLEQATERLRRCWSIEIEVASLPHSKYLLERSRVRNPLDRENIIRMTFPPDPSELDEWTHKKTHHTKHRCGMIVQAT
eukprot:SAG31_NODE_135_length_23206_cov_25.707967_4_plen_90_part_00